MKKYDVAIVGAGPAGVFAAYELVEKKPGVRVVVLESGKDIYSRVCQIAAGKVKSCINCKPCSFHLTSDLRFQLCCRAFALFIGRNVHRL